MRRVNEIWMFTTVDPNGNEGILSAPIAEGTTMTMPLLTSDQSQLPRMKLIAEAMVKTYAKLGQPFTYEIRHFVQAPETIH